MAKQKQSVSAPQNEDIEFFEEVANASENSETSETATEKAPPSYEELLAEKAAKEAETKRLALLKDSESKIAKFESDIKIAKQARAKFEGDDETTKMSRELMQEHRPHLYADIMSMPEKLEQELKAYRLSLLGENEKDLMNDWLNANEEVLQMQKMANEMLADIMTNHSLIVDLYPEHFKTPSAPKRVRSQKSEIQDDGNKDESAVGTQFTGTLLTSPQLKSAIEDYCLTKTGGKSIKAFLATGGALRESDACREIYGCSLGAKLPDGKPIKSSFHGQWKSIVLDNRP